MQTVGLAGRSLTFHDAADRPLRTPKVDSAKYSKPEIYQVSD